MIHFRELFNDSPDGKPGGQDYNKSDNKIFIIPFHCYPHSCPI